MIKRHNAVLFQIDSECREKGWKTFLEPGLSNGRQNWRPDLIVTKSKSAVIVEVTVAFDDDSEYLQQRWKEKYLKYNKEHVLKAAKEFLGFRDCYVDILVGIFVSIYVVYLWSVCLCLPSSCLSVCLL